MDVTALFQVQSLNSEIIICFLEYVPLSICIKSAAENFTCLAYPHAVCLFIVMETIIKLNSKLDVNLYT
jgi:CBS domain containing-hemolysin-like protein